VAGIAYAHPKIAQTRVCYGYRMIRVLLNRKGWKVGKDLVYRLYKEEGLGLRKRPAGRRRAVVHRQERFMPTGPNQVWAMETKVLLFNMGSSRRILMRVAQIDWLKSLRNLTKASHTILLIACSTKFCGPSLPLNAQILTKEDLQKENRSIRSSLDPGRDIRHASSPGRTGMVAPRHLISGCGPV
jgi:hypothetical protein